MGSITLRARTYEPQRGGNAGEILASKNSINFDIEEANFKGIAQEDEKDGWEMVKNNETNDFLCMPLLYEDNGIHRRRLTCVGLVLRKINNEDHYTRFGIFNVERKTSTIIDLQRYQEEYSLTGKRIITIF